MPTYRVGASVYATYHLRGQSSGGIANTANAMFGLQTQARRASGRRVSRRSSQRELSDDGTVNLIVDNAVHVHTADNLTLTQVHQLAVADAVHAHTADTITLPHNLIVQDALHGPAGWVDFPGTASNSLSTADAPELDILGDICIVARIAPDDWTSSEPIVAKWVATGNQRSYLFREAASGGLTLNWSADGGAGLVATSTTSVPTITGVADGDWKWVAVTLDVDNGSSQNAVRFWHSDDGSNWAQLGATVTAAGVTSIAPTGTPLVIGDNPTTSLPFGGRIAHVSIRDGIGTAGTVGGTEVFRLNAATDLAGINLAGSTFTAGTGQTVTVNRSGSPATELVWQGGHTADNIVLTQVHNLTVADAVHAHAADALTLTQVHNLTVADGSHTHSADSLTLTQVHELVVADAVHAHSADNVVLASSTTLTVADASHGHTADALTLTQVHVLTVADGLHGHSADNVTLTGGSVLAVHDGLHSHSADNLTLTQVHVLHVNGCVHNHTADGPLTLTQVHQLVVADCLHSHTAEAITLGIPPTGAPSRSRVWRVLADDRVLAPIHDRIIRATPSPADARELTPGHDRTIHAPANTRTIGVTP